MKQKRFIKLTQDLMFKSFFSKDEKVLISLLKSFLPALQDKRIESIQILNPESATTKEKAKQQLISLDSSLYPRFFNKKQITLDLRLKLNTGENINVEMQCLSQKAFLERILFYWARLYTEDLKRGEGYEKLYPAYSLVFTDFDVLPLRLTDYINSFSIRLDKQPYEELTNHLKIVIVELSKFKYDQLQNLDKKGSWCYVLKKSENLHETELEILKKKGLGGAMALLKNVSESDRLRYEQESRDKFLFDQRWDRIYKFEEGKKEGIEEGLQKGMQKGRQEGIEEGLQKGIQKGRQEGIEEGMQKGMEEVVLNMLENGFDLDSISKATNLSREEIKKMKRS